MHNNSSGASGPPHSAPRRPLSQGAAPRGSRSPLQIQAPRSLAARSPFPFPPQPRPPPRVPTPLGLVDAQIPPLQPSVSLTGINAVRDHLAKFGYSVGQQFDSGSHGTVHHATKTRRLLNGATYTEDIVCKVINLRDASPRMRNIFLPREINVLRVLRHENLVRVFDVLGPFNERVYLFMEFASGGNFLDWVLEGNKHGPMNEAAAKGWFWQMMRGLRFCHDKGFAHRDIKCENILMDQHGTVKWTDFGYTRPVLKPIEQFEKSPPRPSPGHPSGRFATVHSRTFLGSACYKAPEIMQEREYNPLAADMWSLGVTFYVLLTGLFPFSDEKDNYTRVVHDMVTRNWSFPPLQERFLSFEIKSIVARLMEPHWPRRLTMEQLHQHDWFKKDPFFFHN